MSRLQACIFPTLLLLAACAEQRLPAVANAEPAKSLREAQSICLAAVVGDSPVDRDLKRAQASVRQRPDRAEAWLVAGRGWVRKARLGADPGFHVNVDACADEALHAQPGYAAALELRGLVLMNNHEFEAARALSEQILAWAPDSAIAQGTLSDALLELGRYPEAARAAQAQMDSHPGMAANTRAAHLNWLNGDTRSAKLFIRDALLDRNTADPEAAAWTFAEAGTIYWQQGDYDGADAIFSEALRWLPEYPAALVGRGRVALAKGQAPAAIGFLARAQRRQPSVETAWLLGDAFTLAGDNDGASNAYADAERQGRRSDRLMLALFLASKNRNADEALRLIEAERRHRGGIYADDAHAWALYRTGRYAEARRASAQALRLGTRDARLIYHAGAIELALGAHARGRQLIAEALALNPKFDFSGAAEARRLLVAAPARLAGN